jgi:Na+/H+-dicarboxylate symporter
MNYLKKLQTNILFQLLIMFGLVLCFGDLIPLLLKKGSYALSLSLKEVLVFSLPLIIFSYLTSCLLSLKQGALRFIVFILGSVILSNTISILAAYGVKMTGLLAFSLQRAEITMSASVLEPLWRFNLPLVIKNDWALFAGLGMGAFLTIFPQPRIEKGLKKLKGNVDHFLNKIFIPILPVFILGFILKLSHEGQLQPILKNYAHMFGIIIAALSLYILTMYGLAVRFKRRSWITCLRNVFPSAVTGFSTMSSAATMPITLYAAEKNTHGNKLVEAIIPATVNIHLIGDSIGIPIMVMVVMAAFGHPPMDFSAYLLFTGYFLITKFAVAAIPGATILLMVPVLEAHFGFTAEMSALITSIYILFDPVITAANVTGNGAFAMLFANLFSKKQARPQEAFIT